MLANRNVFLSEGYMPPEYLEYHILNGYTKSFYFINNDMPDIWTLSDIILDEVYSSGKRAFKSEAYGMVLSIHEICIDLIEETMCRMGAEFINQEGIHINDAQIKIFESWDSDE